MAIRVEILGFAGAAPLHGACPSYVVSDESTIVLLDCGPGTLERLWRRELLGRLDAIVISHMHADHILDLVLFAGEVVQSLTPSARPPLYVPREDGPEVLARLDAVFAREPGAPTRFQGAFDVREYDESDRIDVGRLRFSFAATAHAQPCFAVRVSDGRAAFVYGADGSPSEALDELAAGADALLLEATFVDDAAAAARDHHMTAAQAGAAAARAGAATLLLTHTLAGAAEGALLEEAASSFGGSVEVAREGTTLTI
jgi:ribonuclease BN (tRNA processing enzyme)